MWKLSSSKYICLTAIIILMISAGLVACGNDQEGNGGGNKAEPAEPVSLEILCVGDIMAHTPQIKAADMGDGTHSFKENFEDVKAYIEGADLALCNLECTFAGPPYTGYPVFSAPDALAFTLKDAGFDIAVTSNNHMLDKGVDGLKRTLEVCSEAGLMTTGTHFEGEKNYLVTEVKGVKIGIVAYTYETTALESQRTLNGNPLSEEADAHLNSYSDLMLDQDLLETRQAIEDAEDDGAEIVICYFHWGQEYERTANEYQIRAAESVAGFGADVIFASHPHVLQNIEYIEVGADENADTDTDAESDSDMVKVPVFYSMGNFLSNQREETLNNRFTEQGMLAYVSLVYDPNKKELSEAGMSLIPTWLDKYNNGSRDVYKIIPLDANLASNPTLQVSGHLSRAQQAFTDCEALFGGREYLRY